MVSPRALKSLLAGCVLLTAVSGPGLRPNEADAGPTTRAGNETLNLKVAATPQAKAKKRRGARLHVILERGTVDGQRSQQRLRSLSVTGPHGLRYNPRPFPRCLLSSVSFSSPVCPGRTRIGFGTATADGRPDLPQLVQLPLEIFNSRNDLDFANRPRAKPLPGLIVATGQLWLQLDFTLPRTFVYRQPDEPLPISLVRIDATMNAISRRGTPYVQLPAKCPRNRRWRFTATERHYDGPTLKATHDVRCRRR